MADGELESERITIRRTIGEDGEMYNNVSWSYDIDLTLALGMLEAAKGVFLKRLVETETEG